MSKLYNFNSCYALCQTLYNVKPTPSEFEDIGLNA